jgi:hypothetical protein
VRDILDREEEEPFKHAPADRGFVIIIAAVVLHACMYLHGTWQNHCGFHLPGMLITLTPMALGIAAFLLYKGSSKAIKWTLVILIVAINLFFGLTNYMIIC